MASAPRDSSITIMIVAGGSPAVGVALSRASMVNTANGVSPLCSVFIRAG